MITFGNLKRAEILAKPGGSYVVEDRLFAEYLATITDSAAPDSIPKSVGNRVLAEFRQKSRGPEMMHPERPTHSHSLVAGGFPEMSYTTREIPGTSLITRCTTRSRNSCGNRARRAVMKSMVSTARSATT